MAKPGLYKISSVLAVFIFIMAASQAVRCEDINTLLREERFNEAENSLKKRLAENPDDYITATDLGRTYLAKGEKKLALRFLNKAIEISPGYPQAHFYLGRLCFLTRDYEKIVSEFAIFKKKMREITGMDDDTKREYINNMYYLSEVYFTLERYDEAKDGIEEILRLDPKEQNAYYNLGVYYYRYEHNRSKAYQLFKKTADMDPNTAVSKSAKYAIEFMRNNPDSRVVPDFSFIEEEYKE